MFVWLLCLTVAVAVKADESSISSYSSPVGTSYTVPLTNSYSAPVPKHLKYSVSAADLDSSSSNTRVAPVFSAGTKKYSTYGSAPSAGSFSKTLSSSYSTGSKSGSVYPAAAAKAGSVYPASTLKKSAKPVKSESGKVVSTVYSSGVVDTLKEKSAKVSTASAEAREDVSSSYQAPAAPAAEAYGSSASAAAPASTGHLYYYYYPVVPEVVEKADNDEIDPLVAVLLPITVLVGFLALLSIINTSINTGGRSFGRQDSESTFGSFAQLQTEIDEKLNTYYQILESESCMDRVVCELGTKAKNLSGKDYLLSALDWIIPSSMTERINTFKTAVSQGYEVHQCKEYACASSQAIAEKFRAFK